MNPGETQWAAVREVININIKTQAHQERYREQIEKRHMKQPVGPQKEPALVLCLISFDLSFILVHMCYVSLGLFLQEKVVYYFVAVVTCR